MREDGLLAIRKRRFVPQTTDSKHAFEVAINVARWLTPTAMNQLWVADNTYVRLGRTGICRWNPSGVVDITKPASVGGHGDSHDRLRCQELIF